MSFYNNVIIVPYSNTHHDQILSVWEKSVLATHHFLSEEDFQSIKELVKTIDFSGLTVYCLMHINTVAGFIGIANAKVEMLFLSPDYFGQGLGKQLMNFAVSTHHVCKVDVNEQNTSAVLFYQKLGFKTYERSEKDDQGKNYPLLRMTLADISSLPG